MLIKEYRIPLPLTVEEYRIAQLYMIAKKSRDESKGTESGVEILVNEPYEDGPGGSGQYTHKIYHIGSHLPGWFKGLLPMSRLAVEEKAWNSYPYTKTRFSCPFVQRFSLEIETYYCGDGGHQDNVFKLTSSELRNRVVDVIDVVKDQLYGADYVREEDPRWYVSQKTGRGPIGDNWIEEYSKECVGKTMPLSNGKSIMTAYKLCKVELQFWGMQSKLENYIHSIGLRKTMLRAHRQAWAWQDEWHGLTMSDIREIERQTQDSLKRKMAGEIEFDEIDGEESSAQDQDSLSLTPTESEKKETLSVLRSSNSNISTCASTHTLCYDNTQTPLTSPAGTSEAKNKHEICAKTPIKVRVNDMSEVSSTEIREEPAPTFTLNSHLRAQSTSDQSESSHPKKGLQLQWSSRGSSKSNLNSPGSNSDKSFELLASWRMETLTRRDSDCGSGSDDEFFDCLATIADDDDTSSILTKWSSMELVSQDLEQEQPVQKDGEEQADDSIFCQPFLQRVTVERERTTQGRAYASRGSFETSLPGSPTLHGTTSSGGSCGTTVLCLVIHAGSALDATVDFTAKKSDVTTFKGAFESVIRQHYPSLIGHVVIKLVSCPAVCADTLGILSSLSPYSFDVYGTGDSPQMTHESVPIGAIPILSTSKNEYWESVAKTVILINQVYQEFLRSQEGQGFSGQIVFIGDSMGSVLGYDALTKHAHSTQDSNEDDAPPSLGQCIDNEYLSAAIPATSVRRRSSSSASEHGSPKLDFEVTDFFMFGTPLGLILAHRKVQSEDKNLQLLRPCHQVYNLFHPTDPLAARLEPLISARFAAIAPVNIARYSKYPLGDGQPYHLLESIQCNPHAFSESSGALLGNLAPNCSRRLSDISIQSGISSLLDALPLQAINLLTQKWWGNRRLDFALYCPEALANFPTNSLPHLFHASYWESADAIAFIFRQIGVQDTSTTLLNQELETRLFTPNQPREKWMKKRTSVKLKNVSANHRANDIVIKEGQPQILRARFMYGPLDVVGLTGEKVDIYVMKDPPAGEWSQIATEVTDKNGRATYTIPPEKSFSYGIYPIKMIVRGDHTCVDFYCAVVPPYTECVVFSIDGSFTASMSVTGRDPRVRAGAVDVTRHWQELGYLIIYVTGRPDMQQHKVVSWLAQHNFPHGLVSFADGLSTDFLGHKIEYLKCLVQDQQLIIHAAYGSSKDIAVYTAVGVLPERIFIIGKVSKKQHTLATVLLDGYSNHLDCLMAHGGSRPAQGNARMVIPRGYFGLPGQPFSIRRRKSAKRTASYTAGSHIEETSLLATEAAWGFSSRESKSPLLK